jgi:XrtJ-associated TM-motif-TM protein
MKEMLMNRRFSLLLAAMLMAIALPLHAQTGCDNSPESPTIVLALVGGIGVVAAGLRSARKPSKPKS